MSTSVKSKYKVMQILRTKVPLSGVEKGSDAKRSVKPGARVRVMSYPAKLDGKVKVRVEDPSLGDVMQGLRIVASEGAFGETQRGRPVTKS